MATVILVAWGAAMFLMAGALVYCRDDIRRLDRLIKMVRDDVAANGHQVIGLQRQVDRTEALVQQNCKHKWGLPHRSVSEGPRYFISGKNVVRCEICGMDKAITKDEVQKFTAAYHKRKAAEAELEGVTSNGKESR